MRDIKVELERLELQALNLERSLLDPSTRVRESLVESIAKLISSIDEKEGALGQRVSQEKTIPAVAVLRRCGRLFFREANERKIAASVVVQGEGKLSVAEAELAFVGCLHLFRMVLNGPARQKQFPASLTISLQLIADMGGLSMRVGHDRAGKYTQEASHSLRSFVSQHAGWCEFKRAGTYGGFLKISLPETFDREDVVVLRAGQASVALPRSAVRSLTWQKENQITDLGEEMLATLSGSDGFVSLSADEKSFAAPTIQIGVADYSICLQLDEPPLLRRVKIREGSSLLDANCWYSDFAQYVDNGNVQIVPFIEGAQLLKLCTRLEGGQHEV